MQSERANPIKMQTVVQSRIMETKKLEDNGIIEDPSSTHNKSFGGK